MYFLIGGLVLFNVFFIAKMLYKNYIENYASDLKEEETDCEDSEYDNDEHLENDQNEQSDQSDQSEQSDQDMETEDEHHHNLETKKDA